MADLDVAVLGARAEAYAAVPTLSFQLRLTESGGRPVHAVALRAQIRIEPKQRHYSAVEEERLEDLFGLPQRWGETLHPFLWAHVATTVPGFHGQTDVDLPMACTYDFEVAAGRYLHSLADGEIPLVLLFSGTVFTKATNGAAAFSAEPVPWHLEAHHRLPVRVWRDVMDRFFPNSGWLRLSRETINSLQRFRTERALPTWDQAFETLLKEAGQ